MLISFKYNDIIIQSIYPDVDSFGEISTLVAPTAINTIMKYFTYRITNIVTNKMYYGWTNKDPIEKRLQVHFNGAKQGKLLLQNSIRKHGESAFKIELVNTFNTRSEATTDEIKLIAEGKTNHCRYPGVGYNMTDGGEGTSGYKRSAEAIQQTANKNRGRVSSRRGKTYEEIYGDRANEERETRRLSRLGYVPTEETKRNLSVAKQGNKNGCFPVEVIHETGEVAVYSSRGGAAEALGISPTTLGNIARGTCWRAGKKVKYKSPHNITINLLRTKI